MNYLASWALQYQLDLPAPLTRDLVFEKDVRTQTRDGTILLGDHIIPKPSSESKPPPLIFLRGPYGRASTVSMIYGRPFAERGFQVFIQSCRGTFGSGIDPETGKVADLYAYKYEETDGIDTLLWLKKQTWYPGDGRVFSYGPSYLAQTQYAQLTSSEYPADTFGVSGIIVGTSNMRNRGQAPSWELVPGDDPNSTVPPRPMDPPIFQFEGSVWWMELILTQEQGGPKMLTFLNEAMSKELSPSAKKVFYDVLPVISADVAKVGREVQWFRDAACGNEEYWKQTYMFDRLDRLNNKLIMVTGWHDIFLSSQINDFKFLQNKFGASGSKSPTILIGPWTHTDQANHKHGLHEALYSFKQHLLELDGNEAKVDPMPTHLKSGGRRDLPVRLMVMGTNVWKDFLQFPPPAATIQTWYIQPDFSLLTTVPPDSGFDSYTYDPRDPTPQIGGAKMYNGVGILDQRPLESRSDVLVYTTPKLEKPVETISDNIVVFLHATSSLNHTDFVARLCDVLPNGESQIITDGIIRVSGGEADTPRSFRITLSPTAYCFERGHRIRLHVCSSAHPRYVRNLGTGEQSGTGTEMRVAQQKVWRDSTIGFSRLVLPLQFD
ncbi:galactose-binding domain-like protein [Cladochytrium replicatum]|nr:galactose-binding domain-like protein [Cladochytrium replicatum]